MEGLCLRSVLQGITPAISAAGDGVFRAAAPDMFSFFKHPVNSMFSGAKHGVTGAALDDAILMETSEDSSSPFCSSSEACACEYGGDEEEEGDEDENEIEFDRKSFSKMVKKVSLSDAQFYAQMCYLGNLAYAIPSIMPRNFKRQCGLRYVTSSIEKRERPSSDGKEQAISPSEVAEMEGVKSNGPEISAPAAFDVAATAASYSNACKTGVYGSSKEDGDQDVPEDDLNPVISSPCEWYVCDDEESATRFFVIQGSVTLASWQANLLIEPIQFEGAGFYVHRGIYEVANGMYQQMLPEIREHMKAHGTNAKLRFTGHSLGGSLSLLLNLMLLVRGEVPLSSLLPVITFGSPTVMCRGDEFLSKLGFPRSHVQVITMHRDIVPRVFSCHYPCHVVELLKAVNANFQNHSCLNKQKLLYAPMGDMLILQPDSSFSPHHKLLPSGSGIYLLRSSSSDADEAERQLGAAKSVFLNTPHPLEILSDPSAYGNGGSIQRDHDMNSYLKCIHSIMRHELSLIKKAEREQSRKAWWPLISPRIVSGQKAGTTGQGGRLNCTGFARTGAGSLKRLSRLMTSHHMHLLVVLLFPVRMLLMGLHDSTGGFC